MSSEKPHYKIEASTLEEFAKIEEYLKKLPEEVLAQVEKASLGHLGCDCTLKKVWGDSVKIAMPADLRQITTFGDYEGCYTEKYFFRVPLYDRTKTNVTYFTTNRGIPARDQLIKELRAEIKSLSPGNTFKVDVKENGTHEEKLAYRLNELIGQIEKL